MATPERFELMASLEIMSDAPVAVLVSCVIVFTSSRGALDMLSSFSKTEISYPLRGLNDREVRFTKVIDASQMLDVVKEYVK